MSDSSLRGLRRNLTIIERCHQPTCNRAAEFALFLKLRAGPDDEHGPIILSTRRRVCGACRLRMTPANTIRDEWWNEMLRYWRQDPKAMVPERRFTELEFRPV